MGCENIWGWNLLIPKYFSVRNNVFVLIYIIQGLEKDIDVAKKGYKSNKCHALRQPMWFMVHFTKFTGELRLDYTIIHDFFTQFSGIDKKMFSNSKNLMIIHKNTVRKIYIGYDTGKLCIQGENQRPLRLASLKWWVKKATKANVE